MIAIPKQYRTPLALLLTAVVGVLSLLPGEMEDDFVFSWVVLATPSALQNSMHLLLYALLTLAWLWARPISGNETRLRWILALIISYGISLEVAQGWIPGRFVALSDIVLNTLGACLAAWWFSRQAARGAS